jgi:hypothetical protein
MATAHPEAPKATLVTVVCVAVACLSLFGGMNSYRLSVDQAKAAPDNYGGLRAQTRFSGVLPVIPPSEKLGYFTDIDPKASLYGSEFMAVQYAVAPRELFKLGGGQSPQWAVGNFSKPQDYAAAGAVLGYELVTDFTNGVVLFRRKKP